MNTPEQLISRLGLIPHREGGWFREIYRSEGTLKTVRNEVEAVRNHSTAIYFLLTSGQKNALHRIASDEIWHFYSGSSLAVYEIDANGNFRKNILGTDAENGEMPALVIKAGNWFCAEVTEADSYTLAGCTVSPGFDFEDFELAVADKLALQFPEHEEFIRKFS